MAEGPETSITRLPEEAQGGQMTPEHNLGIFAMGLPWCEESVAELKQLAELGLSRREIGLRVGRTTESVRKAGNDHGVRFRRDAYGGTQGPEQMPYDKRAEMVECDRRMIRALAMAIYRGEHLPGAMQ
jgi:hypothetical protein